MKVARCVLAMALFLSGCSHARTPPRVAPERTARFDAAPSDAADASGDAPPERSQPPRVAASVRGSLRESREAEEERCELAEGARLPFDAEHPALELRASEVRAPLRAWARSNGRVVLVLRASASDDGPSLDCVEAEANGAVVELALPRTPWERVELFVASRVGERGPYVAGVRTAEEALPELALEPLPSPAGDEVFARWRVRALPECSEEADCAVQELVLEGAVNQVLATRLGYANDRCYAYATPSREALFGYVCTGAGLRSVFVERRRGQLREVEFTEGHGNCEGPCPHRTRVLHRLALPRGARLVPHPRAVLEWSP